VGAGTVTPLAPHIEAFLEHLRGACDRSQNTITSYSDALRLLLVFLSRRHRTEPCKLLLEHIEASAILDWLGHLEEDRKCSASTRNLRLAAIRSFLRFVQYRAPKALDSIGRVLAIPSKKTDAPLVPYLTTDETRALCDAPDPTSRAGIRDRALLYMTVTLGLRASELVSLRLDDVALEPEVSVLVRGKGRRHRRMPLPSETAKVLRTWLAVRGQAPVPELFLNARRMHMTRSGFAFVLCKYVRLAAKRYPAMHAKRVSPHVLRHTCAMNTLRATKDIRKVALWLGHASVSTTERYLHVEPQDKLETAQALSPPALRRGRYHAPDRLLAMLAKPRDYVQSKVHKGASS